MNDTLSVSSSSMQVLLVHPDDSLRAGSWATRSWDLVIDLGKSFPAMGKAWSELANCPVVRLEEYRRPVEDLRAAGEILRTGNGVLLDSRGIDWWELTAIFIHPEVEIAMLLRRLVAAVRLPARQWVTRLCWQADALARMTGAEIKLCEPTSKSASRARHYASLLRNLSLSQIGEIAFDKYDAGFLRRATATPRRRPSKEPSVLVPTAYTNVSRGAAAYARLLPEQQFLFVATRRSGLAFEAPQNVTTAKLAAYAARSPYRSEQEVLRRAWPMLLEKLRSVPEFEILREQGRLDCFPQWLRDGVQVREAWTRVLEREPITAVLCGDDTNWFTRLPVALARQRSLPTVDFHHGAFDGRFLLKTLPSDTYLAKNEAEFDYLVRVCRLPAERIVIGAPPSPPPTAKGVVRSGRGKIVYFSEPYESQGGRADEVYRDLLPALCNLAREQGTRVVVKLHPFESRSQRESLIEQIHPTEQSELLEIVQGPLSAKLLSEAWFGITVESTTVADCTEAGVPCFLCAWLNITSTGYADQFARYNIGHTLVSPDEIPKIPDTLRALGPVSPRQERQSLTPERFRELLSGRLAPASDVR